MGYSIIFGASVDAGVKGKEGQMAPAMDKFKIFNAFIILVTLIFGFINVFNHLIALNFGGFVVTFVITLLSSMITVSNFADIEFIVREGGEPSLIEVCIVSLLYVFVVYFFAQIFRFNDFDGYFFNFNFGVAIFVFVVNFQKFHKSLTFGSFFAGPSRPRFSISFLIHIHNTF